MKARVHPVEQAKHVHDATMALQRSKGRRFRSCLWLAGQRPTFSSAQISSPSCAYG